MNHLATTILIACRNEEDNIERCVREVLRVLPAAEILVIDGGADRTLEIAASMARQYPNVKPIRNVGDRGKGHAIKTGISLATGDVMAQFDCDMQFYADDLPALLAPLYDGGCDLVVGSRFMASSDRTSYRSIFLRDLGNRLMAWYIRLLTGWAVTDVTTGMKAWTAEAIRAVEFKDDRYSYEAEIIVRAARKKLRWREVPVRYASREAGASMHRGGWAVVKAGLVIMAKSLAARFL